MRRRVTCGTLDTPDTVIAFAFAASNNERPRRRMELSNSVRGRCRTPSLSRSEFSSESVRYESISLNSASRREFLVLRLPSCQPSFRGKDKVKHTRIHSDPLPSVIGHHIYFDDLLIPRSSSDPLLFLLLFTRCAVGRLRDGKGFKHSENGRRRRQDLVPDCDDIRRISRDWGKIATARIIKKLLEDVSPIADSFEWLVMHTLSKISTSVLMSSLSFLSPGMSMPLSNH